VEILLGVVFLIILFAGLLAVSALINGFVLTCLWSWFIVPTFGLAELSLTQAIGLGLIVGFLTHRRTKKLHSRDEKKSITDDAASLFVEILISPFIVLFFGWVVTKFM